MTRDEWNALMERPEWMQRASCRGLGPEQFYPHDAEAPVPAIRAMCAACPVRAECLAYALNTPERDDHGIWGGLSKNDRGRIRDRWAS